MIRVNFEKMYLLIIQLHQEKLDKAFNKKRLSLQTQEEAASTSKENLGAQMFHMLDIIQVFPKYPIPSLRVHCFPSNALTSI